MDPVIVLTVLAPQTCSSQSPFSSLAYLKFKEEQVQMIIISGQNQSYFLKQRWMPPGLQKKKKNTSEIEQSWLALDAPISSTVYF